MFVCVCVCVCVYVLAFLHLIVFPGYQSENRASWFSWDADDIIGEYNILAPYQRAKLLSKIKGQKICHCEV